jgi:hypothetical protein
MLYATNSKGQIHWGLETLLPDYPKLGGVGSNANCSLFVREESFFIV